jgi:hypothetical protein
MLPLSLRDPVNHGPFHFLVDFQNADPDPVFYPDSRVERSAERVTTILENPVGQFFNLCALVPRILSLW